jgi:AraC-like DNA-binding protein
MYHPIMLGTLKVYGAGHFAQVERVHTVRPTPTDYLFVWATRGHIRGTLGGEPFHAAAGEAVVMPPGVAQDYESPRRPGWEWLFAHFDGDSAAAWSRRLGANPTTRLGRDPLLRGRWLDMVAGWHADRPVAAVRLAALFADLIEQRATADGGFVAVRRYVQENLAKPLTAAELAGVAGHSVPHFNRLFREAIGTSPMRYVAQQRIARAKRLLRDTSAKLPAIAAAVGYVDVFHFSRLYKQHTGRPPSRDRDGA